MTFNNVFYGEIIKVFRTVMFVSLIALISSCGAGAAQPKLPVRTLTLVSQDGKRIPVQAEVADTDQSRTQGLMYRKKVPEGTGMLFVFDHDQVLTFWMKNTLVPLSIAYISSEGKIIDILDMESQSLKPIVSSRSVRYALEVPQGYFARVGIREGDLVSDLP
ncbi:DUF192 domain-containing protein [Gracilinema caldarium]|uniref:DUF192 domain-containing protein n=1 Tax=Gracilinema caldarium TaxID=215591 RepID=UPI0026ECA2B7|nr:DUF192 domain-containing protein [Gracilinema caldarium]